MIFLLPFGGPMDSRIQYINSITKACEVLSLFHSEEPELGIREISARLAMNKTTVYRIVKTLELNGFLIQNPDTMKYSPGFAILELAHTMYKSFDDKQIIYPIMEELRDEFNEDVVLSILNGSQAVCIDRLESTNGINLSSRVGAVLPLHMGATGKVFLPYLPKDTLETILTSLDGWPEPPAKVSRSSLEMDIAVITDKGYISSVSELDDGVYAVAVPIFTSPGKVKYSLGVCGTVERMEAKGPEKVAARLLAEGKVLSKRLESLKTVQK